MTLTYTFAELVAAAPQRVRAALSGGPPSLDDLSEDEQRLFYDLLGESFDHPHPASEAFYAQRREEGGGVGMDEEGRLVRQLPGGGTEVIG